MGTQKMTISMDLILTQIDMKDNQTKNQLTALIESLQKAKKQKKLAKIISPKELANMKKAYDAASAFTTIMSNTLDKSVPYEAFELIKTCYVELT